MVVAKPHCFACDQIILPAESSKAQRCIISAAWSISPLPPVIE